MAKIIVVGSLNMDLVGVAPRIPVVGETIIGNKYFTEPGGKGANQAYAAAKLGGDVAMLGRVGDDDFGQSMRSNLLDVGCGVQGLQTVPGTSGVALIFVAETGQNSIIVVPGANDQFLPEHVEADAAHFTGANIILLQLENPAETVVAAARQGRKLNARVILDPAPAPSVPLPKELLGLVHILTPNETEAAILAGLPPGRLNPEEAKSIANKLQSMGATTIIMKLGDQGCLLVEASRATLIPAPNVNAIDTTAAGDVFNAGLAVALGEGMELANACRFAVHASALSVTRMGAQIAAPSRPEVNEFASKVGQLKAAHVN
jgi:ribokinase